jgi:hypothetical protein
VYNRDMLLRRALVVVLLLSLAAVAARAQEAGTSYWEPTELPQQGLATFYARGMMEYVYDYRARQGDIGECPECVGTVALLRAGDIGRKIWLQPPMSDPVGPFLVIDCARRQDVQQLLDRNWVVDISFELGQMWGMNRPLDDVLVFEDPADAAFAPAGSPDRLPTRFSVDPGDVVISPPTATPDPVLAADGGLPTPWPTRQPLPLPGVTIAPPPDVEPVVTVVLPPTATVGPPPLTPVITTPTPAATDSPSAVLGGDPAAALPAATPEIGADDSSRLETSTPPSTGTLEAEVSIGRAGGGLLTGGESRAVFLSSIATPPRIRPLRTPRPALTPFLPQSVPVPAITPAPEDTFWERILREIRDLLR